MLRRSVSVSLVVKLLFLSLCAAPIAFADDAPRTLTIAVYAGPGTSASRALVVKSLQADPQIRVIDMPAEDIRAGKLAGCDILVHPGGSAGAQGRNLEEEGREAVRQFIRNGGGYMGICAGAYLAACDRADRLCILDAHMVDLAHWARGTGMVDVKICEKGCPVFGVPEGLQTIYYGQGPLLAPGKHPEIEDYIPLAIYEGEIAKKGAPSGVMPGTTAIAGGVYGDGRVLCLSPHAEKTPGLESLLVAGARWLISREPLPMATTAAAP